MNDRAVLLLKKLEAKGVTLASVESVTGGMFGAVVTEVPGASKVYRGGIVSYSVDLKKDLVRVDPKVIEEKGVVSQAVAVEMAVKARPLLGADIVVSCTGNAGPDVEPGGQEVGRVCLGLVYNGYSWGIPLQLKGDREEIRRKTVDSMLSFVDSLFPDED